MGEKSIMDKARDECPLTLKTKDPKFSYRWVSMKNVEMRKNQGYVVVNSGEKTKEVPVGQTHKNDGSPIRYQTLVLMKMPVEDYKKRQKKKREFGELQSESIERNFVEETRKKGVEPIKEQKIK